MASPLQNEIEERLRDALAAPAIPDDFYYWVLGESSSLGLDEDPAALNVADHILHAFFLRGDGMLTHEEFRLELHEALGGIVPQSVSFGSLHLLDRNAVVSEPQSGSSGAVVYSHATLPMREELRPIASDWSTDLLYRVTQGLNRAARLPVLRSSG